MSKSRLYDNGNGGIGMEAVFDDAGKITAIGLFTRTTGGADVVVVGALSPDTRPGEDGTIADLDLTIGRGMAAGDWPQAAATRVPCGRALIRQGDSPGELYMRLIGFDINAGELLPSPPPPLFEGTFSMKPLTT